MSRGGIWAITKDLVEERQLLQLSCADWTSSRISSKYLAIALYIEFLFATTLAFYAFGENDDGAMCFGQTFKFLEDDHPLYKQVAPFRVDGMINTDIAFHFRLWFTCGFFLTVSLALIQCIAIYLFVKKAERVEEEDRLSLEQETHVIVSTKTSPAINSNVTFPMASSQEWSTVSRDLEGEAMAEG